MAGSSKGHAIFFSPFSKNVLGVFVVQIKLS